MATDLAPAAAELDMRLAAAQAEIEHLRGRNADLTRRINGTLHLIDAHDPASGAGHTAVLLVDLRYTLTGSREASR